MRPTLTAVAFAVFAVFAAAQTPPTQPTTPPPSPDKARELFAAGKIDDALKELQAAHRANPKLALPRVALAAMFFEVRQGQKARVALEQAAAEEPKHPDVYILNANFAFNEGRITDAVLNCLTALQFAADPRWDPAQRKRFVRESRMGLSASYEARGDWASAREHLSALLAEDSMNGILRQRHGNTLFALDKLDEAFAEFKRAFDDDPASEAPEVRMAALYASRANDAKAEEWFKKAVAVHSQSAKVRRAYASWLIDAGKLAEAQAELNAAVQTDPKSRDTLALKGLMARYKKEYAEAEAIFEQLHKETPNDPFATWNLALALAESGNVDKQRRAVLLAQAEAERNQRNSEGLAILGWCLAKAGRRDDAERLLAMSTQQGQISRDAAYFLAKVLTDKQQFADALKVLKTAATARGAYVYRTDAEKLLTEVEAKVPKDEKK